MSGHVMELMCEGCTSEEGKPTLFRTLEDEAHDKHCFRTESGEILVLCHCCMEAARFDRLARKELVGPVRTETPRPWRCE